MGPEEHLKTMHVAKTSLAHFGVLALMVVGIAGFEMMLKHFVFVSYLHVKRKKTWGCA